MDIEHMFDKDSFTNEITSASEAEAAYKYFTHNLTDFRLKLASEGYEQEEKIVRQCWTNLVESSRRVGYTNPHLEEMAKRYSIGAKRQGINRALKNK